MNRIKTYNEYLNSINEVSFIGKEINYEKIVSNGSVEFIINDSESNDVLKIRFVELIKDNLYERIFSINGSTTKYSNKDSIFHKNILKYVSYITKIFITKYKPPVLLIIHMQDAMLSSEKRMKHNKLYLSDIINTTDYNYKIMLSDNTYATFLYNDTSKFNDIIDTYYDDIPFEFLKEEISLISDALDYKYEEFNSITFGKCRFTFNIDNNDIIVDFIGNDGKYEREFFVNESLEYNKINTNIGIKIIKAVTYITKVFMEKKSPDIITLIHISDDLLSSSKRMNINRLFLKSVLFRDYKLYIYNGMDAYISIICKNESILNSSYNIFRKYKLIETISK